MGWGSEGRRGFLVCLASFFLSFHQGGKPGEKNMRLKKLEKQAYWQLAKP